MSRTTTTTMSIAYIRTAHTDRFQMRVNGRLVALGSSGRTRANRAEAEAAAILAAAAAPRGLHVVSTELDYGSDHLRNKWTMRAVLGVGSAPVAAPVVKDSPTAAADEAHADACAEAAAEALSDMIEGYLDCALWASVPLSEDESADQSLSDLGYERANCCADTRADARAACEGFVEAHGDALRAAFEVSGYTPSHAGHDLFLSRNGHGAGFFDHGEHPCWDVLQAAARGLGATEDVTENADGTCTVR